MTGKDRFGLNGDPEIQTAKRVQVGASMAPTWLGPVLALALGLGSAYLLFTAHHWPGWLGGVLGMLAALRGFVAWRGASDPQAGPLPRYGSGFVYGRWLILSYLTATQGYGLETRLNAGPLKPTDLIFPGLYVLLVGAFIWQTVQRRRRG